MSSAFRRNFEILLDLYNSVISRVFMLIINNQSNLFLYIRIALYNKGEISFNIY